jgi:hypothetical protein
MNAVVDNIIALVDLPMSFALIVIPDPSAASREHGLDAQQPCHSRGLNPALRFDESAGCEAATPCGARAQLSFVHYDVEYHHF